MHLLKTILHRKYYKKKLKNRFAILDLRDFKLKKPIANFRNLLFLKIILRRNDY